MSATAFESSIEVTSADGAPLGSVSARGLRPNRSRATVVIAHGAGGTMETPSIVSLTRRLSERDVTAVHFNFLYSEKGKKAPDRQPALVATWRAVAEWVRLELGPKRLFLAGRSMGGRMASYLAADGYPCDGLLFLAYPLHPPGKPDRLRAEHLSSIRAPMLFVSGTRDSFAEPELLGPIVERLKAKMHWIEGADHGFRVSKKYGRTAEDVDAEVAEVAWTFFSEG